MTAVENLIGLKLKDGWEIIEYLHRHVGGTGGNFSVSYKARRGSSIGFVKAFDFSNAFEDGKDTTKILERLVSAYNHERDVLLHCKERRMDNVVMSIAHGSVIVPGFGRFEGTVFYLIFEMADGDIRRQMDESAKFDSFLCIRALRDICLGLWQVHREDIAHQDTKPSNVLMYPGDKFKVADFGRCSMLGKSVWYDDNIIAGDRTYAPPELLYGHVHSDFAPRRLGCDMYMLGNLAAFLFTGVNVTSYLFNFVDPQHRPAQVGGSWKGVYAQVLPYLMAAFTKVLEDLSPKIDETLRPQLVQLIRELCTPDLEKRGQAPKIFRTNRYSLERYVSMLDLISKRTEVSFKLRRKVG